MYNLCIILAELSFDIQRIVCLRGVQKFRESLNWTTNEESLYSAFTLIKPVTYFRGYPGEEWHYKVTLICNRTKETPSFEQDPDDSYVSALKETYWKYIAYQYKIEMTEITSPNIQLRYFGVLAWREIKKKV